jgi:hypothetical protein
MEFDLEMKPIKLVKGKGLARLFSESNCRDLGVNFMNINSKNQHVDLADKISHISPNLAECTWYKDIIYFLQKLEPPKGLEKNKVRDFNLKEIIYCLIDHVLYWKYPLGVLLRCLDPQEAQKAMNDFHDSLCGGHHFWRTMAYKILRDGYFWPSLFTDVFSKIRSVSNAKMFLERSNSNIFL